MKLAVLPLAFLLIRHLHWTKSTFTKILKSDICTRFWNKNYQVAWPQKLAAFQPIHFFIKFNLLRWLNASINVELFHQIQFSFYKATQFPFIRINNQIWLKQRWKSKIRVTSSNPRVTSSNPRVTSSNLRVTSSNPRVTSLNPRFTSSNSRVTSSNPRVTSSNPGVRTLKAPVARLKARVGRLKARDRRLKARFGAIKPRVRYSKHTS